MDGYLAFDVGGSKYIVGLIERTGRIIAEKRGVWRALTREAILEDILGAARALLRETGCSPCACGITIPGLADPERGMWVSASFSGIRDFPICAEVERALGIPVYCDNDGQAYALAEMRFGSCRDVKDFVYLNVSNGIGSAVVAGGRLVCGADGTAGELGHCVVVEGGRSCKCGLNGCLEMHAAGPGIARNYDEMGGNAPGAPRAEAKEIAERARAGEETALRVFELEGELIARVLGVAINLLNPAKVVIGGGVSLAFDLFAPSLKRELQARVYRDANPHCEVIATPLGYLAGLYSAAAIAALRMEG